MNSFFATWGKGFVNLLRSQCWGAKNMLTLINFLNMNFSFCQINSGQKIIDKLIKTKKN